MSIRSNLADAVGNTPLIRLNKVSAATGCTILGKAEFLNPGQSVKDRAALYIIRDAVARGALEPGGTIVEGTAGNTGIGLALVGASMGFRTVIVIPETQSQEKKDMLRLAGARPGRGSGGPVQEPEQLREIFRAAGRRTGADGTQRRDLGQPVRQYRQPAGPYRDHGPEIWQQTDGTVDGFICAVGSGGTLAGVGAYLQPKGVRSGWPTLKGAGLFKLYTGQDNPGNSITEGIGQGRITANLDGFTPDFCTRIPDEEALPHVFDLLSEEGLCLGGSSGVNVAGAVRMARTWGRAIPS